jgi:serine/threonine protein kinase
MLIKDNKVLTILCNDAHILHRDISPNNIMLVRDDNGRIRNVLLIDFDYASTLKTNQNDNTAEPNQNVNNTAEPNQNVNSTADFVGRFRTVGILTLCSPLVDLSS